MDDEILYNAAIVLKTVCEEVYTDILQTSNDYKSQKQKQEQEQRSSSSWKNYVLSNRIGNTLLESLSQSEVKTNKKEVQPYISIHLSMWI